MTDDHGPPVDEYVIQMNAIAQAVDILFNGDTRPRKTGFALLVFPFSHGDEDRCSYISNAEREDMLTAMKEFIARAEGRYEGRRNDVRQ